jgi:hypothetical protein
MRNYTKSFPPYNILLRESAAQNSMQEFLQELQKHLGVFFPQICQAEIRIGETFCALSIIYEGQPIAFDLQLNGQGKYELHSVYKNISNPIKFEDIDIEDSTLPYKIAEEIYLQILGLS